MGKLQWKRMKDEHGNIHYVSRDRRWDIIKIVDHKTYRVYDRLNPKFNTRLFGGYRPEDRKTVTEKTFNCEFTKLKEAKEWVEEQREV